MTDHKTKQFILAFLALLCQWLTWPAMLWQQQIIQHINSHVPQLAVANIQGDDVWVRQE